MRPLVLLTLIILSTAAAADDAARALLDKMSHSFRELNYQGTFSYQQGDSIESLRIAHALIDGEEFERLQYLDGEPREILRRGHTLTCIHPGHQLVRLYHQQSNLKLIAEGESTVEQGIEKYYGFSVEEKSRIAGRDAVNLLVRAKDTHRYSYRLALDEETGLLLRSELLGAQDQVLERFQFVEISLGAVPLDYFDDADNSYQAAHVGPVAAVNNQMEVNDQAEKDALRWRVGWLPGGFMPVVADRDFVTDDMVTFTDGMTVFSVFLERKVDPETMAKGVEGVARRGATIAYSRALLLAEHPHRVTVVGEIPKQTAQQIAQSVVLLGGPQ